jgi:phosphoenolpyruvate carboxylase
MATKTSKLPFEQLPNLPPPVIPVVDLRTEPVRWDLVPREHAAVAESRYSGQYYADQSCQTYESELGDVKQVSQVLEELSESVRNLRKDLSFAQSVMKAEYESKIMQRAIELHHVACVKLSEVEKEHKEKLNNVRESYRILLNNAVKRICAEYKAYYEDLLSGKTDRHDLIIKNLKERYIHVCIRTYTHICILYTSIITYYCSGHF